MARQCHQWRLQRLSRFKRVRSPYTLLRCILMSRQTIAESFAAKHLPDMGYEVKDFKVFTWKLGSWKKLDKKLTSPDFECGGHKWCVILRHIQRIPSNSNTSSGVYYYSPSVIPTHLRTTPSPSISTMLSQRRHQKAGTHAPSLPLLSPTFMIPQYSPSAVRRHCIILKTAY